MMTTTIGDEVWGMSDSSSDINGSDVDSEPDLSSDAQTATPPMRSSRGYPPVEKPVVVGTRYMVADKKPAAPNKPQNLMTAGPRFCADNGKGLAENGLMSLVAHLRSDNTRLREALSQAQHDLEALAAQQAAQETPASLDFAHILALVRDFGEDSIGFDAEASTDASPHDGSLEIFAISSPRCSEEDESEITGSREDEGLSENLKEEPDENELQTLKAELERSRREVVELRRQIQHRDAELFERQHAIDDSDDGEHV